MMKTEPMEMPWVEIGPTTGIAGVDRRFHVSDGDGRMLAAADIVTLDGEVVGRAEPMEIHSVEVAIVDGEDVVVAVINTVDRPEDYWE